MISYSDAGYVFVWERTKPVVIQTLMVFTCLVDWESIMNATWHCISPGPNEFQNRVLKWCSLSPLIDFGTHYRGSPVYILTTLYTDFRNFKNYFFATSIYTEIVCICREAAKFLYTDFGNFKNYSNLPVYIPVYTTGEPL